MCRENLTSTFDNGRPLAYKSAWSSSGTMPRATPVSRTAASISSTSRTPSSTRTGPSQRIRRWDYGEDRYRLLGAIEGRVFAVIYTMRDATIRIISARKANRREVRECEQNTVDD